MARNVTMDQIEARVRQLTDSENDANVTSADIMGWANVHAPAVYDECVLAGPSYFAATKTYSVDSSGAIQDLPVDFLKGEKVYVMSGATRRRIYEVGNLELYSAATTGTVEFRYVPACRNFTTGSDTFDGIDGFDELISAKIARDINIKRGRDNTVVVATIDSSLARIQRHSRNRDRGSPHYPQDTETEGHTHLNFQTTVSAYMIRGGNLEFYYRSFPGYL